MFHALFCLLFFLFFFFFLQLTHFLEHGLLDEQVDAIFELGGHVTRLRSFGNNYKMAEYIWDQNMK